MKDASLNLLLTDYPLLRGAGPLPRIQTRIAGLGVLPLELRLSGARYINGLRKLKLLGKVACKMGKADRIIMRRVLSYARNYLVRDFDRLHPLRPGAVSGNTSGFTLYQKGGSFVLFMPAEESSSWRIVLASGRWVKNKVALPSNVLAVGYDSGNLNLREAADWLVARTPYTKQVVS
jgi:hypothetical protein